MITTTYNFVNGSFPINKTVDSSFLIASVKIKGQRGQDIFLLDRLGEKWEDWLVDSQKVIMSLSLVLKEWDWV